ncbi:ABC transporter permease [Streptomyces brevispora]|uniref:Putative ABC transport system permease protein n=1 Tax=Streptomyces brevispora TaxID=887462 RepID=A0A561V074_9ACTN|nr:ABC transporter permease [Streptomyces brevispora]TWG04979.1 putative ABC transport system permease protein [Streptomyces brevispora]
MIRGVLRKRGASAVDRSVFSFGDLLGESLAGMLQRPARSALTALGTVLGVGTFVAILGLTATASSQIDARFNSLSATEVSVEDKASEQNEFAAPAFPPDADERVERLNGVRSAGVYWPVRPATDVTVRSAPVARADDGGRTQVVAASPGVLEAAEPTLSQGRIYDDLMSDEGAYVAVIGSGVASRLGITTLETRPAVFVGDQPFTVTGIIENTERKADLLLSVVVPRTTAEKIWGPPAGGSATMLVSTELGAAQQVARLAPTALRPDHPEYLKALPPPDPRLLRSGVSGDLSQLFLLLAGICLVIGAVGIANTTLVSVLERTGEIGLRRALGARARHITLQFLAESGVLGAVGGLIGTSLGVVTVVGVALARDWTPVVHPATAAAAPAIGLVTGVLAGLYPAWRASRIQPAEALRR